MERQRRTARQGVELGRRRAARFRAERDRRARSLGYQDVADLLHERYENEGASVAELAQALRCAEITITSEMDRSGIPRRPQEARLAMGREVLAARRAAVRAEQEARVGELGFDDLSSYLRERHLRQRWPRRLIAEELGVTVSTVVHLMRREDVPALRGVKAATARRADAV